MKICFSIRKKKSSIKYLLWPLLICFEEKCINQVAKLSGNRGGEESSIDLHSDQLVISSDHWSLLNQSKSVIRRHEVPHLPHMNISVSILLKTSFPSQQYYYENKLMFLVVERDTKKICEAISFHNVFVI